jgi:hypothetical protein
MHCVGDAALSTTGGISFFAPLGWPPPQQPIQRLVVLLIFLFLPLNATAHAQEGVQFLPEVDTHLKLNSRFHLYMEAKGDRDGGDPLQAAIGPSLQLYLKSLAKLKEVTAFDLDDAKPRFLVLEAGYRFLAAPDTPPTNRMLTAFTINLPAGKGFHVSDRNRADLDWQNDLFSWRYRNKLTVERSFSARSYHFIPYLAAEPYYESQYKKWSTTSLFAGCIFPVGSHVEFNPYYEDENNTGKHPNDPVTEVGLALFLFFSLEKK